MAAAPIAVTVAATAYQMYANSKANDEKEAAARDQAAANFADAKEMQDRLAINTVKLAKDYGKYKGDVGQATAAAGIDINSSLYVMEQVNKDYIDETYNMQREANYRIAQTYKEGQFSLRNAQSISSIGRSQNVATFMQGAGQAAAYSKYMK